MPKFLTPTYTDQIPFDAPKDPETGRPICKCGRLADKLHCPGCGSLAIYGLSSRLDTITTRFGKQELVPVYRCRRCGGVFNKHTHQTACDAPSSLTTSMKDRRRMDAALDAVSALARDRKGTLERLFANVKVPTVNSSVVVPEKEPTDEPSK